MNEYEIRILRADGTTATIMEVTHLNDFAAIRAARKFARASQFEVWRDLDCIYGDHRMVHPPYTPHQFKPPAEKTN